jgi:hypothetical protein
MTACTLVMDVDDDEASVRTGIAAAAAGHGPDSDLCNAGIAESGPFKASLQMACLMTTNLDGVFFDHSEPQWPR